MYYITTVLYERKVDEREEQLRQLWADHRNRFKSGAKRSSLRGVIRSSYLPELGAGPGGRAPSRQPDTAAAAPTSGTAASSLTPPPPRAAVASSAVAGEQQEDDWEDVPSVVRRKGKWVRLS